MDVIVFALGLIATVGTVAFGIPQAVKSTRTRSRTGVSIATWWMALIICWPWGAYGLRVEDPFLTVTNVLAAIVAIWVLVACDTRHPWRTLMLASSATAAAFFALSLAPSVLLVGFATAVMILSRVPQLVSVVRSSDVSGVSLTTWWLSLATASTWMLYGVLRGDAVVYIANGIAALITAALVTRLLYLQNSRGRASTSEPAGDSASSGSTHENPNSEKT